MKLSILIIFLITSFKAHAFSAKIVFIKGEILKNNSLAKSGEILEDGDTLETKNKTLARIKYLSGDTLTLGPNTRLELTSTKKNRTKTINLLSGKLRAKFSKKISKDYKLRIQTRSAALGIRGTEVKITYNKKNNITSLITLEGEADFINKHLGKTIVEEGQISSSTGFEDKPTRQFKIAPDQLYALVDDSLRRPKSLDSTTRYAYLDFETAIAVPINDKMDSGKVDFNGDYIPPRGLKLHETKGFVLEKEKASEKGYDDSLFSLGQFQKTYKMITSSTHRELASLANSLNKTIYDEFLNKIDSYIKRNRILSRFSIYAKVNASYITKAFDRFYEGVISNKNRSSKLLHSQASLNYTKKYKNNLYIIPNFHFDKKIYSDLGGLNSKKLKGSIKAGYDSYIRKNPYQFYAHYSYAREYRDIDKIENTYNKENVFTVSSQYTFSKNYISELKYENLSYDSKLFGNGNVSKFYIGNYLNYLKHRVEIHYGFHKRENIETNHTEFLYSKKDLFYNLDFSYLFNYYLIKQSDVYDRSFSNNFTLEKEINQYFKVNSHFKFYDYNSKRDSTLSIYSKIFGIGLTFIY